MSVGAHPVILATALAALLILLGRHRIAAYYKAVTVARHYLGVGGSVKLASLPDDICKTEYYRAPDGRNVPVLFFRSESTAPAPLIILFHGATPLGEEHPGLVAIARGLTAAGYVVCIPRLPQLRRMIINGDNLVAIRLAYDQLLLRTDLHNGRVGVMGTSFAGSLLLKVLSTLTAEQRPLSVLSYGSYCNLETSLRFIVTGKANFGNEVYEVAPDPWGQVIFFYNYVEHIPGEFDRTIVGSLLREYVGGAETEVRNRIVDLNPPEGQLMAIILGGPSPALVELMEAVLLAVKPELDELSPSAFYPHIDFRFNLLHGRGDTAIPYTEALNMQALLPKKVRLHITGLLSHKELHWGRDFIRILGTVESLVRAFAGFIYPLER